MILPVREILRLCLRMTKGTILYFPKKCYYFIKEVSYKIKGSVKTMKNRKTTAYSGISYGQVLMILLISGIITVITMPVLLKSKSMYKTQARTGPWLEEQLKNIQSSSGLRATGDSGSLHIEILQDDGAGNRIPLNPPRTQETTAFTEGQRLYVLVKRYPAKHSLP